MVNEETEALSRRIAHLETALEVYHAQLSTALANDRAILLREAWAFYDTVMGVSWIIVAAIVGGAWERWSLGPTWVGVVVGIGVGFAVSWRISFLIRRDMARAERRLSTLPQWVGPQD